MKPITRGILLTFVFMIASGFGAYLGGGDEQAVLAGVLVGLLCGSVLSVCLYQLRFH